MDWGNETWWLRCLLEMGRLMERLISHNGWNADRAVRVRRHKEWRIGG